MKQVWRFLAAVAIAATLLAPAHAQNVTCATAPPGTNDNRCASTAFVQSAIITPPVTSVFSRTGAITAQTGDYSISQITGGAALASPAFSGVPTAPTAAPGTNTTQLATTAFVLVNGGAVSSVFGRTGAVTAQSGDYTIAQINGLGTGVATALGVNVGTAGAVVVNGGALGSPSSAGTIPAFTLGGAVAGGGNQINNVVIGNSTPLAGSFTTLTGAIVNINPAAASTAQGLVIRQTSPASGSVAGPITYNLIDVTHTLTVTGTGHDSFGLDNSLVSGFRVNFTAGTTNLSGQAPVAGTFAFADILGSENTGVAPDRIALLGSMYSTVVDTSGHGIYAGVSYSILGGTGSTTHVVGHEADVGITATASAQYRAGFRAVNQALVGTVGNDTRASVVDAAFVAANIGTAAGAWGTLLAVQSGGFGQAALATTADFFYSDSAITVANIFNLPTTTVTGNIANFPNLVISGSGGAVFGGGGASTVAGKIIAQLSTGGSAELDSQANTTSGFDGLSTSTSTGSTTLAAVAFEPANTSTAFGLTLGNWSVLETLGSGNNGLVVGTRTDKPIIFGQNNLNLMQLVSGGKLNIGPFVTPNFLFTINANTVAPAASGAGGSPVMQISGANATSPVVLLDAFGTNQLPYLIFRSARGTAASYTATQSGDLLGFIGAVGANAANTFADNTGGKGGGFFGIVASETWTSSAGGTELRFYTTPNTTQSVAVAGRFQNSGGLTVGAAATDPGIGAILATTSIKATTTLTVAGMGNTATTSAVCYNTGTGLLTYDGTIGTCTVSDERLKNMGPRIDHALDKLLQINGVYYTWKDPAMGAGQQIGVGAQTVERVFPELVQTDSEGRKSADYQRLTSPIIEAMRELKADNDNLKSEIDRIKRRDSK